MATLVKFISTYAIRLMAYHVGIVGKASSSRIAKKTRGSMSEITYRKATLYLNLNPTANHWILTATVSLT